MSKNLKDYLLFIKNWLNSSNQETLPRRKRKASQKSPRKIKNIKICSI